MTSFDHKVPTSGKKIVVSLCGGTDSAYLSCLDAGIDVSPDGTTSTTHSRQTSMLVLCPDTRYLMPYIMAMLMVGIH